MKPKYPNPIKKGWKCAVCGGLYARKVDMRTHMVKKHGAPATMFVAPTTDEDKKYLKYRTAYPVGGRLFRDED